MKNFIVFYYSLNSHFIVLNLFQDLKKKTLKQVQLPFLFMSIAGLDPAIQVYNLANCFTWTPDQVRRDIEREYAEEICGVT